MSENTILWILGGMQGVNLLLLGWIKIDQADIWRRIYNHRHEISCPSEECNKGGKEKVMTGDVIISHEGA